MKPVFVRVKAQEGHASTSTISLHDIGDENLETDDCGDAELAGDGSEGGAVRDDVHKDIWAAIYMQVRADLQREAALLPPPAIVPGEAMSLLWGHASTSTTSLRRSPPFTFSGQISLCRRTASGGTN